MTEADPRRQHAAIIAIHDDILLPGEKPTEHSAAGDGPTADRRYVLHADRCLIGRNEHECDIRVRKQRRDISHKHATIYRRGTRYILEDHSKYGTFVNRQRIDGPWELTTGDVLGFAYTGDMLLFEDPKQIDEPLAEALTKRELDTLYWMATGLPNKEIAAKLIVSTETVKTHLRAIYGKLGVNNRTQAVNVARRQGLIRAPTE